jgi:hypothetical protein
MVNLVKLFEYTKVPQVKRYKNKRWKMASVLDNYLEALGELYVYFRRG